jgi:hypothetical protein
LLLWLVIIGIQGSKALCQMAGDEMTRRDFARHRPLLMAAIDRQRTAHGKGAAR